VYSEVSHTGGKIGATRRRYIVKQIITTAACLVAVTVGINAFCSDGTVGKPWHEQFRVYLSDGDAKKDTDPSLFSVEVLNDFEPYTSLSPVIRNFSTCEGDHGYSITPTVPGHYTCFLSYSGIQIGTFYKTIREQDVDTAYMGIDEHLEYQDCSIGAPLQSNFTSLYTSYRAGRLDMLDVKVSSRGVFSDMSALHAGTDILIAAIDDDPWDASNRSLTDKAGFSLATDQSGVTVGTVAAMDGGVDISFASMTGLDSFLSTRHGTGVWDATGSVTVVPFQGTVSYETATYGSEVHIVRGDSVAIPYSISQDIAGWTVYFGAKSYHSEEAYAIGPIDVTAYVSDASTGSGIINLNTADTSVQPRRYEAELEIRNGSSINTVLRFRLWVDPDVIR